MVGVGPGRVEQLDPVVLGHDGARYGRGGLAVVIGRRPSLDLLSLDGVVGDPHEAFLELEELLLDVIVEACEWGQDYDGGECDSVCTTDQPPLYCTVP